MGIINIIDQLRNSTPTRIHTCCVKRKGISAVVNVESGSKCTVGLVCTMPCARIIFASSHDPLHGAVPPLPTLACCRGVPELRLRVGTLEVRQHALGYALYPSAQVPQAKCLKLSLSLSINGLPLADRPFLGHTHQWPPQVS